MLVPPHLLCCKKCFSMTSYALPSAVIYLPFEIVGGVVNRFVVHRHLRAETSRFKLITVLHHLPSLFHPLFPNPAVPARFPLSAHPRARLLFVPTPLLSPSFFVIIAGTAACIFRR